MSLDGVIKFLTVIVLLIVIIFGLLLFLEWFGFVDYIPGIGEGSGQAFLPDFFKMK